MLELTEVSFFIFVVAFSCSCIHMPLSVLLPPSSPPSPSPPPPCHLSVSLVLTLHMCVCKYTCVCLYIMCICMCVCVWSTERENIYVRETEKACVCILRESGDVVHSCTAPSNLVQLQRMNRTLFLYAWKGSRFSVYLGDAGEIGIYSCSCFPAADNGEGSGKEKAAMSDSSAKPNTAAPTVKIKEWFEAKSPEGYSYYWNITTNGVYVCLSSICTPCLCAHGCLCVCPCVCDCVCVCPSPSSTCTPCVYRCLCILVSVCSSLSSTCTPHPCNLRWMCVCVFLDSTVVRLTGSCIYIKKLKSYICKCFCLNDTVMFYTRCVYVCRCVCVHLCLCVCCLSLSSTCTPHLSNLRWICAVFLGSAVVKLTGSCINKNKKSKSKCFLFKWYSNVPWYIVNWSFFLFLLATAVNCGILCFCVSESVWEPPEEFVSLAEQEGYVEQPADSTQQVSHQEFWERERECVCVCEREREKKCVCVCWSHIVSYVWTSVDLYLSTAHYVFVLFSTLSWRVVHYYYYDH